MVYGGLENETIQLSDETVWSGGPYDSNNPKVLAALPEIRRLIWGRRTRDAETLVSEAFVGVPYKQMAFQTIGTMNLTFPGHGAATNYRRELSLNDALSTVTYRVAGVEYVRDTFASVGDQRHLTQLYAMYPSSQTSKRQTPELYAAAVKSLKARGDGDTGWTTAWKVALRARTEDGNHAYRILRGMLDTSISPNMLAQYNEKFQIDSNFGTTAGSLAFSVRSRQTPRVVSRPLCPSLGSSPRRSTRMSYDWTANPSPTPGVR